MSVVSISGKFAMLLAFLCCVASIATAQDELLTQAPDEYRAYGTVTDEQGQPIQNAKVSLVSHWGEPVVMSALLYRSPSVSSAECSEDGEFDIRVPATDTRWNTVGERSQLLLVVEASGFETSITKFTRDRLLVDLPFEITTNVCKPWTLSVLDQDGKTVSDAKLSRGQINGHRLPFKFDLNNEKRTPVDGQFEIADVSPDSLEGVYLSRESGANFFLTIQSNEEGRFVQLPETGTVNGVFKIPESVSPATLKGKEVIIAGGNMFARNGPPKENLSWQILTLDENASATANSITFGSVMFGFVDPSSVSLSPSMKNFSIPPALTKENSPLEMPFKLYESKKVKILFENEAGEPISNIQSSSFAAGIASDENETGTVTIEIPVNDKLSGQMFPFDPSNQYQVTNSFGLLLDRLEKVDGKPKPITMTRSRSIKGRVINEQGQTVAGAKIEFTIPSGRFSLTKSTVSDLSGDFRIDGLPPNLNVAMKASKGELATPSDANISIVSGNAEEVLLPVVVQAVVAIVGTITDQQGNPIAEAKVKLEMANVFQKEGYSGEELGAVDLIPDFSGVASAADGQFEYPATTQFTNRIQVVVSAPGFRNQRFPFIDGSLKNIDEQRIDLGSFSLFKVPTRKKMTATVVDQKTGEPIQDATLVFIGIDSEKQVARTDNQGRATINAETTRQLVAVKAKGYEIKLDVLESVPETIKVSLAPASDEAREVAWMEQDWKSFHEPGRKLLERLEVPQPKESTFYRQNTFFASQIHSDFKAFKAALNLQYKEKDSLLMLNAGAIFLNAPQESVKLFKSSIADARQKSFLMTTLALLAADEDLKEELYGEAIVEAGECSGSMRLMAFGQLASSLAIDGKVEVAKELITEAWDSADAGELKEQLEKKETKARIGEARIFVPALGLIDANTALELLRLTSRENELPIWSAKCLTLASLAGEQDLEAICQKQNVEFKASGLGDTFRSIELSHAKYESIAKWIEEHLEAMPDSASKVDAAMLAARHLPAGPRREKLLNAVAVARKACSPSYHYDDPTKEILEELPKFDSLTTAEFDELLFATLEHAPTKTDTMQSNMIYANLIKMVAIKDSEAARKMLDAAFENGAWLYGDPTWSAFSENSLLKAYAWIDPDLACQKAIELSEQYAKDDPVRELQLLTTVIGELNSIAIRKGMLRTRK